MTRERLAGWICIAICAIATVMVLTHLLSTARSLDDQRQRNERYDALGHVIAAADTLNIDNPWAATAYVVVPPGATYAVVGPPARDVTDGRVSEITYDALVPYMRYVLLPRLAVAPQQAQYILCYGCRRRFADVRWIWQGGDGSKLPGLRIGRRGSD